MYSAVTLTQCNLNCLTKNILKKTPWPLYVAKCCANCSSLIFFVSKVMVTDRLSLHILLLESLCKSHTGMHLFLTAVY